MLKVKDTILELSASMDYIRSFSDAEILSAGDLNVKYNKRHSKSFELLKGFERKYNLDKLIKKTTPT